MYQLTSPLDPFNQTVYYLSSMARTSGASVTDRGVMARLTALVVLLALLGGLLVACFEEDDAPRTSPEPFQGDELRVGSFGGSIDRQMYKLAGEVFESLTGVRLRWVKGTSRLHLKTLRASKGEEPPFDVVLLDGIIQHVAASEGLLDKLSEESVPEMANLIPQARPKVKGGPAFQFFSVGVVYRPDSVAEAGLPEPASWADFWRPQFKGHLAIPSVNHTAGVDFVVAAARVAGGDPSSIEGLKAGIDAIKKLEPALIYRSMKKLEAGLEDGSIWMAPLYNSRSYHLIGQGLPIRFIMPREKGFGHITTINIPRGTRRKKLACLFINTVLCQGYQYAQAIQTPFGPVHREVIEPLAHFPNVAHRLPLGPEGLERLYVLDWDTINRLRPEMEKYWFSQFPSPGARK